MQWVFVHPHNLEQYTRVPYHPVCAGKLLFLRTLGPAEHQHLLRRALSAWGQAHSGATEKPLQLAE
eukprot:9385200-Prorocentrum_lima.AAC.1